MSGNPANASLWADADVYVSTDLNESNPADAETAFAGGWDMVGLLDGETGFTQSREQEETDHYAWGNIIVRTSRRNFKLTYSFTALEDNTVTRSLAWPGSGNGELVVPQPVRVKLAFETREGAKVRRVITKQYAEVTLDGDVNENETSLASLPFVATIFPDGNGVLFVEQKSAGGSS